MVILLFVGDGFILLDEYVKVMILNFVLIDIEWEWMKVVFNFLDWNNDGWILLSEFWVVMMYNNNEMMEEKVEELFKEVDFLGKGYLDYEGILLV